MQVSAGVYSQTRISLKLEGVNIKKALSSIEKKSSYRFLYNQALLSDNAKVEVNAVDEEVVNILDHILHNTTLSYEVLDNYLVVIKLRGAVVDQTRVTGKVTGPNGEPLPGASVKIKGSTVGTSADASGSFALTVPDNAVLVISSVGYDEVEVAVNGRTSIDVQLKPSTKVQDEVVVIGYGTASKRDLTGSIAKVKGETIASLPNTNPVASLQGRVAGLNIVNSAIPGATPDVRIRGTISIGSVNPVYIIDGIFADNMDFVNPNEIESIEVLKDPSSLAVFGVKGAAGAIVVTTKKAKAGQLNINFNASYGLKNLVDKIKLANGNEFRSLLTSEANNQIADDPSAVSLFNFVNDVGTPGMSAYTGNTDWIDAVTQTANFASTSLGIDGSTDKNRFHMGIGYMYDEGLVKHVRYDRINVNINDEYRINKSWKVGFNIIGSKERLPYGSDALENARRALPIIPGNTKPFYTKNPYGVDSGTYNLYATPPVIQNSETNPMATLEYNYNKKIDDKYRIVGNVFVDVNVFKDLNLRATWYADLSWRDNREYTPLYDLYNPAQPEESQPFGKNILTAVKQEQTNIRTFQQDYIATYKKKFGDHSLTATAGFTTYYYYYEPTAATVSQSNVGVNIIPNDERFWYINTGFGDTKSVINPNPLQYEYATVSYLARALYNYKGKYYLNGSFRRDGASQINKVYSNKWQDFWAVGAAWEITREDFMENQNIFQFLKLKGSHGVLGNFNPLGEQYPAYPNVSTTTSAVFGTNLVPVYTPDYLADPNLHWETVHSSEIGIEGTSLGNRLHYEVNYYYKKTKDLLVMLRPSGILPRLTNAGSIENKGFEFSADWNQRINDDLAIVIGGNLTTYKNKVLSMEYPFNTTISSSEQTASQSEAGYPIGYFYGLVVEGIYQSYADILASPASTINGGNAKPGDLKYRDLDGNGVVNQDDRTQIGNPTPDFTYGFNLGASYRNWSLAADFAGTYGNEIYRVWGTSEQKNSVYNYPQYYTEGWTAKGTSNWVPIVNQAHLINRAPSTYGIEDGSYFRIRNINLAYNFGKLGRAVKGLKLYANVQNLKTWKNNLGYSPEFAGATNAQATSFGNDYGSAGSALPRVITFGVNANF
ncbi:TonB-dependent receptor [Flavihumibacter petaseus]|uniref:Putative TonB-dependent receptor n=1 Tax=Flavihumibacter petaseus NBRC 106054 TaxID=1220578 RepID=A0A0E9MZ14_9BACT|nr:TonB-dependent receptor [Flavihumibacter petaseus]GAO42773.1 putative TonB-dependent receptor [Flavihumibacter petaseus NBRC 106054]